MVVISYPLTVFPFFLGVVGIKKLIFPEHVMHNHSTEYKKSAQKFEEIVQTVYRLRYYQNSSQMEEYCKSMSSEEDKNLCQVVINSPEILEKMNNFPKLIKEGKMFSVPFKASYLGDEFAKREAQFERGQHGSHHH